MLAPLLLVVSLLGPATNPIFPLRQAPGRPTSPRAMLPESADRALQAPTGVSITRVGGDGATFDRANVEGFEARGGKAVREPHEIIALRDALLDPAHYDFSHWGENKWCGSFESAIAISFARNQAGVTALFCFTCNDVVFVVRDAQLQLQFATWADVTPGRAVFLKIAKDAFPKDEAIQALEP